MPAFAPIGTPIEQLGFDDEVSPAWVTVPVDGTKKLLLKDAAGLTLALRNPSDSTFVTVREDPSGSKGRIVVLTGGKTAKTVFLDVRDSSGQTKASLEIAIKKPVNLATFIAFVFDKSGRTTPHGLDDALQMMEVANKIVQPQTNVKLFRQDSGGFRLPFDMPKGVPADFPPFHAPHSWDRTGPGMLPCVSSRPLGSDGCLPEVNPAVLQFPAEFEAIRATQMLSNIVNRIDPKFDFNILYIADFNRSAGGQGAFTGAFTPTALNGVEINCCLMPPAARGQSLAHELCHFLLRSAKVGPGRHSRGKNDLMVENPGPNNLKIPKSQANAINPSP